MTSPVTLIAEDLLLLLLDDDSGKPQTQQLQIALGGALLVELGVEGMVEVVEAGSLWRSAKVHPVEGARPGEPLLQAAWETVREKERSAQGLVEKLGRGLSDRLCERLAERGILERREDKVLGLFPRTRWPARDTSHEEAVRRALAVVLVDGADPDPRTGALVSLLHAIDRVSATVPHEGTTERELNRRAREVSEGQWAAEAVKDAIVAATAATMAAMAAVAAGTAGAVTTN